MRIDNAGKSPSTGRSVIRHGGCVAGCLFAGVRAVVIIIVIIIISSSSSSISTLIGTPFGSWTDGSGCSAKAALFLASAWLLAQASATAWLEVVSVSLGVGQ
jgi:hypothetical protein